MQKLILLSALFLAVSCSDTFSSKNADSFFATKAPDAGASTDAGDGVNNSGVAGGVAGGSTGGVAGGAVAGGIAVTENFLQKESQSKLDILWVVDNSGSMADEQTALANNFSSFASDFIMKDVDFKMAITSTDVSSPTKAGLLVAGSDTKLTSLAAHADPAKFLSDFSSLIKLGVNGSGDEQGLEGAKSFINRYPTFLRPESYLAIVIITDEEDSSPANDYVDFFKSKKSNAGLVKVYTICDVNNTNSGNGIKVGCIKDSKASADSAGLVGDIRDNFAVVLDKMAAGLIELLDSFALASAPVAGSLKVYVNNVESKDFIYDAASHSIKFNAGSIPAVGAAIKVTYLK